MKLYPFLLLVALFLAKMDPVQGEIFSTRQSRSALSSDPSPESPHAAGEQAALAGGSNGGAVADPVSDLAAAETSSANQDESGNGEIAIPSKAFDGSNIRIENPVFNLPKCRLWDDNYINGVVATVEDRVITAGELRQEMAPIVVQLESTVKSQEEFDRRVEEVTHEVLQNMIDRLLIIEEFYRRGYQIPKVEKSVQLDEFVQEKFDGDRLKFTEQLHDFGKSVHRFKKEMEESFVVNIMLNHIRQSRSEISPLQIEKYYEEHREEFFCPEAVRLLQIYVPFDGSDGSEDGGYAAGLTVQRLQQRLDNGTPFSDLAREFSDGGPTDWLTREDLREELREVAFQTPLGQCATPIKLEHHMALICPIERRADHWATVGEVQHEIEARVAQERLKTAQERWIQQLRERAFVKVYL